MIRSEDSLPPAGARMSAQVSDDTSNCDVVVEKNESDV